MSVCRGGEHREPDSPGQVALEKQVEIGFHCPTVSTMMVNMVRIPACTFCCGKGTFDQSPCECFDNRRQILAYPTKPSAG